MSFKSTIEMTSSKYFAIYVFTICALLTWIMDAEAIVLAALPLVIGLYANKQYQDRMKLKYKEEEK